MKRLPRVTAVINMAVVVFPLAAAINLEQLAGEADAVVVGRASHGVDLPDGVGFNLHVVRTVHGKPAPGALLDVVARLRPDPSLTPSKHVNGECGLFLLKRTSIGWEALGLANSPFFSDARIALGDCEAAAPAQAEGLSTFEKSFEEIALAARRAPAEVVPSMGLFDLAGLSDSPRIADIMKEFAQSHTLPLRVEGVAWAVRHGDPGALVELVRLAKGSAKSLRPACFLSAVSEYVNTDPTGVLALGRVVLDPEMPSDYLKQNAAHALRNIHTPDAVPFLAEMLNSPDVEIRAEAVSGLTEHVAGVRPVVDGPKRREALDEAFNPGRRQKPFPVPGEYLRMGPFQDTDSEERLLTYWRGWWQTHKAEFPAPTP